MPRLILALFICLLGLPAGHAEPLRISAVTAPGTPWHDSWLHFKKQLETRPELLQAQFYLGGQLGSEESALSQLRRGRIQLGGFSLQGASSVVPELGMLMSPYLFDSLEEVDFVMDEYLLDSFNQLFADRGLVLLGWAEVGWTSVYATAPLLTPANADGLKLRSSNALASQLFVRAIGADMVPLTFADIMPSLQTGLIQGGESGAIFYALMGLPREAPYLTLTRHAFDSGMYLANRDWYQALTAPERQHLQASLMSTPQFRQLVRDYEQRILDQPAHYGIELLQPTAQQLNTWRETTEQNRARLATVIGGDSNRINLLLREAKAAYSQRDSEEKPGTL
jgi:TRAP-type C4-dicarboxylate transport system substrate-binding protein